MLTAGLGAARSGIGSHHHRPHRRPLGLHRPRGRRRRRPHPPLRRGAGGRRPLGGAPRRRPGAHAGSLRRAGRRRRFPGWPQPAGVRHAAAAVPVTHRNAAPEPAGFPAQPVPPGEGLPSWPAGTSAAQRSRAARRMAHADGHRRRRVAGFAAPPRLVRRLRDSPCGERRASGAPGATTRGASWHARFRVSRASGPSRAAPTACCCSRLSPRRRCAARQCSACCPPAPANRCATRCRPVEVRQDRRADGRRLAASAH